MIKTIHLKTHYRNEMVDITNLVQQTVNELDFKNGVIFIYCPHTTAGITINEGADPDVQTDIINKLSKLIKPNDGYFHVEGNADSHIKSSIIGTSKEVFVENGRLVLGTWQKIFFCEFDGPRTRQVLVKGLYE